MRTPISSKIADALVACGISGGQVEKVLRYKLPDGSTFAEIAPQITDRMQQAAIPDLKNIHELFKAKEA